MQSYINICGESCLHVSAGHLLVPRLASLLFTAGKASHDVITAWMMAKIKDLETRI